MHSERGSHRMYEQWHPLGPVGVITAFNFPVAVWAWNAFIAAIAGDPIDLETLAESAALRDCRAADLQSCHGAAGVIREYFRSSSRIDRSGRDDGAGWQASLNLVHRIGSGRSAGSRKWSGERLGRTLLELSGNNAVIVDETADLDLAIRAILFGAVGTAGQRCTTHATALRAGNRGMMNWSHRLLSAYKQVQIGDPLKPDVLMGPLIDQAAVRSIERPSRRSRRKAERFSAAVMCFPGQAILSSRRSCRRRTGGLSCSGKPLLRFSIS